MNKLNRLFTLIIPLFVFLCFTNSLHAQNKIISPDDAKIIPSEQNPIKQNKKQIKEVFSEKKKRIKGFAKYDEPEMFDQFQKVIRTRDGETSPKYSANYLMEELNKAQQRKRFYKTTALNWIERGPGNVSGRTRGIIVDPIDVTNKTWFAGSVSGGIWKTTDAGVTWTNKTPDLPNLSTTVLAQAFSNLDVIYCGTGEGFSNADAVHGAGIFKSIDHGNTWNQLPATANFDFRNTNRIIVDPNNANIVLACTNPGPNSFSNPSGVHKSTDGGTTWTRVLSKNSSKIQDLKADPLDFSIQYCAVNNDGVYKSTDGGLNWTKSSNGLVTTGRIEIAVSGKNPNYIYASCQEANNTSGLYVSEDKGATWLLVNSADSKEQNWLQSQGWYDNTIAVHPFDETTVFFGGIDLWKAQLTGSGSSAKDVLGVDEVSTSSFLSFVNWGGPYRGGGIGKGINFFNFAPFADANNNIFPGMFNLSDNDYVGVELRFGAGKSQKAHRFARASDGSYQYKDYVTVPFEAWDIVNNKQIMISFRDWKEDGAFDLVLYDNSNNNANLGREYLAVHAIDYNSSSPDPNIAKTNGISYKNIWSMWPILSSGIWNSLSLPASILRIRYGTSTTRVANFSHVTDGYNAYQNQSPKPATNVHVDQHSIIPVPLISAPGTFWIVNGNDGGVAVSTNGGLNWREALNGGYNTTQFYGVDKKPRANEYVGGTQDNGTWISPKGQDPSKTSVYKKVIGGDGFDVAWHYKEPNKIIGGSQYNNFAKTTDGGSTWSTATKGLEDVGAGKGTFISKIAKSNSDPDVIFTTGSKGIWRSEDFGGSWEKSTITGSTAWAFNSVSTPVTVSIADPQIVWAGSLFTNSISSKLFLSTDAGITFSAVNPYSGVSLGSITGIDTHPTDMNTAFITYSISGAPKILRTTDLGNSWQDITGFGNNSTSSTGFPNVATYCVIVMPFDTKIIWVGTEIGLFESIDNGTTWHPASNGLPSVCIWDMKIVDDQIVLATHGRGIWSVSLPELSTYQPPVVTLSPVILTLGQGLDQAINVTAKLRSAYDSTLVIIDGQKAAKLTATTVEEKTFKFSTAKTGIVNIQLISHRQGRVYKSSLRSLYLYDLKVAQMIYSNSFDAAGSDFAGNGFTLSTPAGFSSPAVHSLHPYAEATDYYYNLLVPIKISTSTGLANIEYDDIALVEPGEPGSKFGDSNFWDYVVVEGSRDGINWIPFEDGYDCRYNAAWTSLYDTNTDPTAANYLPHKIDMTKKFNPGEVILIRFHLFSDEATVGWGWAFDNLKIQEFASVVEKENTIPTDYSLSQNFPNPFNPETTIKFSLPQRSNVKLEIYDALGRVVSTLVNGELDAGSYKYNWNAAGFASGVYLYRITANNFSSSKKLMLVK